jgi:hypothetical protein
MKESLRKYLEGKNIDIALCDFKTFAGIEIAEEYKIPIIIN